MKTIKTLFAILFLSSMFIACEAESLNEEVGIEIDNEFSDESDEEHVTPN